jgi:GNAT superfamily N-acetyltransferase
VNVVGFGHPLAAYRDYFPPEATKPDPEVLRGLWAHDIEGAHGVIVAVDERSVIGSVVARVGGSVARLHVHPTRWRQGVGRRLHDAAVDVLRRTGYGELNLWVIDRNAPARAMYEQAGWRLDPSQQLVELDVIEVRYTLEL